VFHTGATIEYRERTFNPVVRPDAATDVRLAESENRRRRLAAERALDNVLADSFPASDPPSWTSGIARPEPARYATVEAAPGIVLDDDSRAEVVSDRVIDVSRPNSDGRTFVQGLVSLAGAVGIALLVPFAILLVGLPVALAVRGTVEAISWLLALIFG
jgi:hypothetical protein